jgi:hypothetical protein
MKTNGLCVLAAAALLVAGSTASGQQDIGTAFRYQGTLENGSGPVTDTCDFRFGLWDAGADGNQVGTSPQIVIGVAVENGVFTTPIDFGAAAINGTARWLAIEVRCPGDGIFWLLSPRVELTPVPHALALPGLYTQQNPTSPNMIGGYSGNTVIAGAVGASINGGGLDGQTNRVTNDFGTIGGGGWNRAGGGGSPWEKPFTTVAGGQQNHAGGSHSAISGGLGNYSGGDGSAIGGGSTNSALGNVSFIGGGSGNLTQNVFAVVGGGSLNNAQGEEATIAGGFSNWAIEAKSAIGGGQQNTTGGMYSSIGGGLLNDAGGENSVIGGGSNNDALNLGSTVGGGGGNTASGNYATVAGGNQNRASGNYSTVAGGSANTASATSAIVLGGDSNSAAGTYSCAAGRRAKVRSATQVGGGDTDGDEGTFIWADSTFADFTSTGPDQFLIRATGGVGIGTNAPGSQLDVAGEISSTGASGGLLRAENPNNAASSVHLSWLNDVARIRYGGNGAGSQNGLDIQGGGDSSKMRILNNGNVGIGTTSPANKLDVEGGAAIGATYSGTSAAPTNGLIVEANVGIGTISPSAMLHVVGDIVYTGTITDISDERLKQNIAPVENASAKIHQLRGVYFNMNVTPEERDVGLIAQDVQKVLPEAVRVVDPENGYLGVAYPSVIPLLVEAIKEQDDAISEKNCKIEELEARLTRLEALLNATHSIEKGEGR